MDPAGAVEEVLASRTEDPPTDLSPVSSESRDAVEGHVPTAAVEDPCASIAATLDEERALRMVAEREAEEMLGELSALRLQNADLWRELLIATRGTHPLGEGCLADFLRSEDAREISEKDGPALLRKMCDYLMQFPVHLQPGEAAWIARCIREKGDSSWGEVEKQIILFLGPARLRAELPPDRLAELRMEFAGKGYFD